MSLPPGTRLGPYEITAPLGAGGMGEVYRARDTRLGRDVAVKVMPPHLSASAAVRARFEREARAISSLNHPHICVLHDIGKEGDTDYLVMELVEGESLFARLARGPLPGPDVLRLGGQVSGALDRAHRAGIIHRDLKPGNVMLTRSGAKLLDFGLARSMTFSGAQDDGAAGLTRSPTVAQPLTSEGALLGTFQYMAPEQLEGKEADARSDIWALGCLLYEMATGKRAFEGASQASLISAIMKEEPRPMAELVTMTPKALDRLVRTCLAKDPDGRWQSAGDVAHQLAWIEEDGPAGLQEMAPETAPAAGDVTYHAQTFRRGTVIEARFLPDGQTIVYGAAWSGGPRRIYMARVTTSDTVELALPPADLLSVSRQGELAISLGRRYRGTPVDTTGVLARAPLFGGTPREIADGIHEADWAPDGRSLAVIRRSGLDLVLEFPIGKRLFASPRWKTNPRVSPGGNSVAFFEYLPQQGHRVLVVGRDGSVREAASLRHWPGGLSWTADGQEIWVSEWGCPEGTVLWAVTPEGGRRIVSRLPGVAMLHDLSPAGDALISQALHTFASAFFGPGMDRERDLTWMDMGFVKDISDDGGTVLMDEQGAGVASDPQVYLRPADGSPPIHLGPGLARGLSSDGRWVIVAVESGLTLLPAGAGEPRALPLPGFSLGMSASWFPDGERILVAGNLEGEPSRLFVVPAGGGTLQAVTPGGVGFPPGLSPKPVSPDGSKVFGLTGLTELKIHAVETGEELATCPLEQDEEPIRWHEDGRTIFTWRRGEVPARITRLDVETGRREPWKELELSDPTGVFSTRFVVMTPDGRSCACTYLRMLSQLHLVRGLR